jgi:hypothetical protein
MTTQIDIKSLAKKHKALSDYNSLCIFTHAELQAFADDYLALSSSEPLTYVRFRAVFSVSQDGQDAESNEWFETCSPHEIGDDGVKATPVYLANPINQQLQTERDELDLRATRYAHEMNMQALKLGECVEWIKKLESWVAQLGHQVKRSGTNLTIEGNDYKEALASRPASILKLLEK